MHSTKLKAKILRKIPDIRCFKQGKFVSFAFDVQSPVSLLYTSSELATPTKLLLSFSMMNQYTEYRVSVVPDDTPDDIDTWTAKMSASNSQFQYMHHVLQLELLILVYTRSIRKAKFGLYKSSLTGLAPWFMMLNHTHYARWLPVHIRDMVTLSELHPQIAAEVENGHFTVNKTGRLFSNMAVDQAHEQNNVTFKGDGGVIGQTHDAEALKRWSLASPEVARVITDFEATVDSTSAAEQAAPKRHHEQTKAFHKKFIKDVKS